MSHSLVSGMRVEASLTVEAGLFCIGLVVALSRRYVVGFFGGL